MTDIEVTAIMNPECGSYRLEFEDPAGILPVDATLLNMREVRDPYPAARRRVERLGLTHPVTLVFKHQSADHFWVELIQPRT